MKTISYLIICSSVALLVGCEGGSESSSDPQAAQAKPAIKEPIPDSPPSKIGISSSTDAPSGVKKTKKQ
ncbi:hypothetical protein LBMAG51_10050 [Phycisphaerae bacterium]|nr:hypothetical protein LBMAG51_10050 [Phycisphaerae bacterium]